MGGESEMVTIYHPDGDHLMMTHYCSAHNQPRMRSQTVAGGSKIITFDLVDVTNLSAPDAGHMKKLVVTFVDKDHFTQEWTWSRKGKRKTLSSSDLRETSDRSDDLRDRRDPADLILSLRAYPFC